MGPIHPGLIAAGVLGVGGVGFLAFKHFGKDDNPKEAKPAGGGDAAQGAGQLGTDPAAQQPTAMDQAGAGAGQATGGALQGKQVGPYTVVDDGTGTQIVFETATQTPVGVLDEQGNMIPIKVDAAGNVTIDESAASQGAANGAGTVATPTAGTNAGVASSAPMGTQAQYSQVAEELFANVASRNAGSATSGAMAPTTGTPTAQGPAGVTPSNQLTAAANPAIGGMTSRQVGEYTIIEDGSGEGLVVDTATQQPLGMIDAEGNISPLDPAALGTGTAGATTPTAAGSVAPQATVSAPTTITSPVGGAPALG